MPAKPKTTVERFAVTATNHDTGEHWTIHDTAEVCEAELQRKLAEWTNGETIVNATISGPDPV